MKTAALFLSGLLLSALASGPAAAEPVRVRLTARVSEVRDNDNLLAGKVVIGQRVTGLYVYNTNTPNQAPPGDGTGEYHPYANEARMRFATGSLVFESVQPTQQIQIHVVPDPSSGLFLMESYENKPLAGGIRVDTLRLEFMGSGNITQSVALANVAPDLTSYSTKEVVIDGSTDNSGSYILRAEIEAVELVIPDVLVISPASGTFVANQQFDAALILPRNSSVASAHAMANGVLLPMDYPGSCQLQAPNSANKPSLLCPGADAAVAIAAGAPIEWTVELTNGTVLLETVNWTSAQ